MTQAKCHIKTGDTVIIISVKTKAKPVRSSVFGQTNSALLVDGDAGIVQKKHVRADPQPPNRRWHHRAPAPNPRQQPGAG